MFSGILHYLGHKTSFLRAENMWIFDAKKWTDCSQNHRFAACINGNLGHATPRGFPKIECWLQEVFPWIGLNYELWFSNLLFWRREYEFLRRKWKAQRRCKNTILRHLCALRKDGVRIFAQKINAATSIKRKVLHCAASKATLLSGLGCFTPTARRLEGLFSAILERFLKPIHNLCVYCKNLVGNTRKQ